MNYNMMILAYVRDIVSDLTLGSIKVVPNADNTRIRNLRQEALELSCQKRSNDSLLSCV